MMRPALLATAALAMLAGCATPAKPLYLWEGYPRNVYQSLKGDGKSPSEQLVELQAQAEKARATGAALPPGFRAHMGLVYVRLGRDDEARQMLEAEKTAFPESTQYIDFVLNSMGKKKS